MSSAMQTQTSEVADLCERIVAYVRGVRADRRSPVTEKQILHRFGDVPAGLVKARLLEAHAAKRIRREPGGYSYKRASHAE